MNKITEAGNEAKKAFKLGGKGYLPHEFDKKDYNRLDEQEKRHLVSDIMQRMKTDKKFSALVMSEVHLSSE